MKFYFGLVNKTHKVSIFSSNTLKSLPYNFFSSVKYLEYNSHFSSGPPPPGAGSPEVPVVVRAWVGKEFPDMRQNEREIKFIGVGNAVSRPAQGRTNVDWGSLVHFYTQGTRSGIGVLRDICWGKSKANTSSLWGRRGERFYCSINNYLMGEGRQ